MRFFRRKEICQSIRSAEKNMNSNEKAWGLNLFTIGLLGCLVAAGAATAAVIEKRPIHIGIVGASGGDIESCEEMHDFVFNFVYNVGTSPSLPDEQRRSFAETTWLRSRSFIESQYSVLPDCNTQFRSRGLAQAKIMATEIATMMPGIPVSAYAGFRYVFGDKSPQGLTLLDALDRARTDGVTHLFVTDQDDILYSSIMQLLGFEQIQNYLSAHPEWRVQVVGLNGYSTQPQFDELLAQHIVQGVQASFGPVPGERVVVILPSQAISIESETTDPHARQARDLARRVQSLLPSFDIRLAFQHAGTDPSVPPKTPPTRSLPADYDVLPEVAVSPRPYVFVSPKLQWPVTDISIWWRQNIKYHERLQELAADKLVVNEDAWDASLDLARFAARIVRDTMFFGPSPRYDLTLISKSGLKGTR
jgi:hypothetical protein